jgi:hypothetical protein
VPACAAMATAWAQRRGDAAALELDWIRRLLTPGCFGTTLGCLRPYGFFYRYERDVSGNATDPVTASVQPRPWHSVLLVATERDGRQIHYLDPFFGPEAQPFSISRSDFANAWTGHRSFLQDQG